jgi:sec-independent protein translocase protein TatC
MSNADREETNSAEMTFWDHVRDLSNRVKVIVYSVFLSTVLMMTLPANSDFLKNPLEFYDPLIGVILRTVKSQVLPYSVRLIGVELTAPIELYVVASIVLGVALSMPVIAYEAFKFIDPAIYPHERRDIYPFITSFTAMFVVGAVFGYRVLAPFLIWAMMPFYSVVGAEQMISVLDFYNTVFLTVLIAGFSFTLPIYFVLLVKYNLVSTKIVTKNRLYLYAALYIVTAILTPDGGPLGDMVLFVPMVVLVELGIIFAKRYEKGRTSPPRLRIFESQTCRFCGKDMAVGAIFCDNCGKSQR